MKIRTDFVTNSSSSLFIIARRPKLSDKQKEIIIEYVENRMLGDELISPDDSKEEVEEMIGDLWLWEEEEEALRKALAEGKTIYRGGVWFEDDDIRNIFQSLWGELEKASDGDFVTIDGDLSY